MTGLLIPPGAPPRRRLSASLNALATFALVLVACTPASPGGGGGVAGGSGASSPSRTVRMAVRYEVDHLAAKVIGPNSPILTRRLFNASHALIDPAGKPRPYLAETLPQLNTESWKVLADGRMETIYRIRRGLTWHDGQPLTAEDFVFGWRVYVAPGLGIFRAKPQDLVDDMLAPDPTTIVIRWKSTYPDAGALTFEELDPLPRHILEDPFTAARQDPAAREPFLNLPFWTTEYVGAGPYRLENWIAGSQLEAVAFDGHALGRPKIDRFIVRIITDENTTLTNMLAGSLDYSVDFTLRFEQGTVLKREWEASKAGRVLMWPSSTTASAVQFRPEFQKTPGLLDVRVRKAMVHSIDRQAINDGVFNGEGLISETFVNPTMPYFDEVQRAIAKHPYDPRRAEGLMVEAGYAKDREGLFASAAGDRFRPDFWVTAGAQFERHQAIMVETWKRVGIDTNPFVLSVVAGRDNETRATFPGLTQIGIGSSDEGQMGNFIAAEIGTAANRWRGSNRGGYVNPEVDRLYDLWNVTLDRAERDRTYVEIVRVLSDQLPILSLYPNLGVRSHVAGLQGPEIGIPRTPPHWNVHEWVWR